MKSHREIILNLLKSNKKVTLRTLFDSGVGYEARSRICELRKQGYCIETYKHDSAKGETIQDNGWILAAEPCEYKFEEDGQMVAFI